MDPTVITNLRDDLIRKIKILNERVWESRASVPLIDSWLRNFTGRVADVDTEQLQALYLLSHFMYFGSSEVRELLRCMFRDKYRYPIIREIRQKNGGSSDAHHIEQSLEAEYKATRFLGVGNPAESGTHLLYYFRQENAIPKRLFIHSFEIFKYSPTAPVSLADPSIRRYVFIDDLAGSGTQAKEYSKNLVDVIKVLGKNIHVSYYVMFATSEALQEIRQNTAFDDVAAVFDLDPTFRCFGTASRYFPKSLPFTVDEVKKLVQAYGDMIWPPHPLGYRDGQLLLGFHHNTPDNTLPIFWGDSASPPWQPMFKRYPKIYW